MSTKKELYYTDIQRENNWCGHGNNIVDVRLSHRNNGEEGDSNMTWNKGIVKAMGPVIG